MKNLITKKQGVLLLVIFLIIILHYAKILSPLENIFIRTFSPVQAWLYRLSVSFQFPNAVETAGKSPDYETLLEKNKKLIIENAALQTQLDQLRQLQNMTQYLTSEDLTFVTAKIIAKDIFQQYHSLTIDKGTISGIIPGLPVVADKGIVIGKITEVENEVSKIMLLTNPHNETAAMVKNVTKTIGVVTGDYGVSMKMELIPRTDEVNVDTIVITSGTEELIPPGLVIGRITRIEKPSHGFFQSAYLQPLIPLNTISFVSVLLTR